MLRVGRVLHLLHRHGIVLDAEVQDALAVAPEVRDGRVVGVEQQPRPGRRRGDRGPAVGDDVQLAIPVELVAEEVREHQRPRAQLLDDLAEPELVDLEQPEGVVERTIVARCL